MRGYVTILFFLVALQNIDCSVTDKCKGLKFKTFRIGTTGIVGHLSTTRPSLSWYEAVCCCRSRGLHLISPSTTERMQDIKVAIITAGEDPHSLGWVDVNTIKDINWRNLMTGKVVPVSEPLFAFPTKVAKRGHCLESGYYKGPLVVFDWDWPCEKETAQNLLCEESSGISNNNNITSSVNLTDDCFGIGSQVCDKNSIDTLIGTGLCIPASRAATTTKPTTTTSTETPLEGVCQWPFSLGSSCCTWWSRFFG